MKKQTNKPVRRGHVCLFLLFALSLLLLTTACGSNEHMYRHNRSHCDCPTF